MSESYEQEHQLRALAMRVAALEDSVAFLEEWCEEQQDALDRAVGPAVAYDYETGADDTSPPPRVLRIVDLRDSVVADDDDEDDEADEGEDPGTIVALVETAHDQRVRQIRHRLNRLRSRLAETLAPPEALPAGRRPRHRVARRPADPQISAKQAGRTAP